MGSPTTQNTSQYQPNLIQSAFPTSQGTTYPKPPPTPVPAPSPVPPPPSPVTNVRPYVPNPLTDPQNQLAQMSIASIFNPQPAPGFQLDASKFPFISAGSIPQVSGGGSASAGSISAGSINPASIPYINEATLPFVNPTSFIDPSQVNVDSSARQTGVQQPPEYISNEQIQNALQYLANPASPFDVMSGGPIVDEINQRTNALQNAYETRQFANLDKAQEMAQARLAEEGVLSGTDVLREQGRLAQDVLNDISVVEAGMGLENTKYLGDLAMRDIENRSNNMRDILTQALIQRGQDSQSATAEAARISNEVITQSQLRLQAQVANLSAEIQAQQANLDAIMQARSANLDANVDVQLGNLQAQTQTQIANLNAQTQTSIANMQAARDMQIANAQIAAQTQIANLDTARALQLGQLDAQTRLALGSQAAGVDLLGLLSNDYANAQNNYLNTAQLPLNILQGLTGPMNLSSSGSKSL